MGWRSLKQERCFAVQFLYILGFLSCIISATASFEGSDSKVTLQPGNNVITSPGYSGSYPAGSSARYTCQAPVDTEIKLTCTINMPKNGSTCSENFYVARDGFSPYQSYCGQGIVTQTSLFNVIIIAYTSNGTGGSFSCQLFVSPQACDCGWSVNAKISNGETTASNEFTSFAALVNVPTASVFCGGAILSHGCIATAAHCVKDRSLVDTAVLVGSNSLQYGNDSIYAAMYSISKCIIHPDYEPNKMKHNIALCLTVIDIQWSRGVSPICLPPTDLFDFTGYKVKIVGYGAKAHGEELSTSLQKADVTIASNQRCAEFFGTNIYSSEMCTYDPSGEGKRACQSDDGGPVIYDYNRQFLFALMSYGRGCGMEYSFEVSTCISSYLVWINQYCNTCKVNINFGGILN